MGTEVTLDQGHLALANVMLTAYSAAFPSAALPVTAVHTYQFTGQVTGALAASLGQGGRIVAMYANGETLLWENPANFSGTTTVQRIFTANDSGAPTRLALTAVSQPVPIAPGQSLALSAAVRGELAGPAGQVSGQLAAYFYDSQGNLLAVSPIWQATAYSQPTTPLTHRSSVSHPTAVQMRVGLRIAW